MEAFDLMIASLTNNPRVKNDLLMLKSQLINVKRNDNLGLKHPDLLSIETNRITNAQLEMLDQLNSQTVFKSDRFNLERGVIVAWACMVICLCLAGVGFYLFFEQKQKLSRQAEEMIRHKEAVHTLVNEDIMEDYNNPESPPQRKLELLKLKMEGDTLHHEEVKSLKNTDFVNAASITREFQTLPQRYPNLYIRPQTQLPKNEEGNPVELKDGDLIGKGSGVWHYPGKRNWHTRYIIRPLTNPD